MNIQHPDNALFQQRIRDMRDLGFNKTADELVALDCKGEMTADVLLVVFNTMSLAPIRGPKTAAHKQAIVTILSDLLDDYGIEIELVAVPVG